MDIRLAVSGEDVEFSFNESQLLSNGNFYTQIALVSGCFTAHKALVFERSMIDRFVQALQDMDMRLFGTATLQAAYERDIIVLSINRVGHVRVSGILYQNGNVHPDQELHFAIDGDQTCLGPLWRDFARLLATG
jgi:hypothetical protein